MNGCVLTLRTAAPSLFICAALTACGGGGGGGTPPTNTPTTTPIQTPSTTNATGTVVNDANGAPLSGVSVKLMPWAPCNASTPLPNQAIAPENDDCPTPLPSPQATTAANGTFALNGAPNGHYLLVIGTDTVSTPPPGYAPPGCSNNCGAPTPAPFTAQATIHDNVTLNGGNQTLTAPTLPAVPEGYTPPTWETNGEYRLATLDATTEMPCYIAWQYERTQLLLAPASVDEWLLENVRAVNAWEQSPSRTGTTSYLTTGNTSDSGGTDCASSLVNATAFTTTYATNPHTVWFAGQYVYSTAYGIAEFPIDPRFTADPNFPNWP